jgi:hypothetical protein
MLVNPPPIVGDVADEGAAGGRCSRERDEVRQLRLKTRLSLRQLIEASGLRRVTFLHSEQAFNREGEGYATNGYDSTQT